MTLAEAVHNGFSRAIKDAARLILPIPTSRWELAKAKFKLQRDGWSYRSAAPVLGCTYQWIARVLNGHENSEPLLTAIEDLPTHTEWSKAHEQVGE